MRPHSASFTIHESPVQGDITFKARKNGKIIGTLKVGPGGIRWLKANGKKAKRYTWTEFARKMLNGDL